MDELRQLAVISGILLVGFMSPGPNFAAITATAMTASRRAGVMAGLGMASASVTWTLLAVMGIGAAAAGAPWLFTGLRVLGALYLVWLGVVMLARAPLPMAAAGSLEIDGLHAFRRSWFISMTNPKALAFYGSILSVTVPTHAPLWFYAAVVGLAGVISAGWYCTLALVFSNARVQAGFARAKLWIEGAMGLVLIALGAKLLLAHG